MVLICTSSRELVWYRWVPYKNKEQQKLQTLRKSKKKV